MAPYNTVVAGNGTRPHRLYYACTEGLDVHGKPPLRLCLAESKDGLIWVKPNLGLYSYNGSTQNNIVVDGEGCTPFLEPLAHTGVPAGERWKMVCSNGGGTTDQARSSPDGLRWTPMPRNKALTFSDDTQCTATWDAALGKYAIFVRRNVGAHGPGPPWGG